MEEAVTLCQTVGNLQTERLVVGKERGGAVLRREQFLLCLGDDGRLVLRHALTVAIFGHVLADHTGPCTLQCLTGTAVQLGVVHVQQSLDVCPVLLTVGQ